MIRANPSDEWRTVPIDGQRLRQIRAERGLSQEKLASKSDLGLTTIRRLECEPSPACRAWTRDLIATALETQPASLAPAAQPPETASSASTSRTSAARSSHSRDSQSDQAGPALGSHDHASA